MRAMWLEGGAILGVAVVVVVAVTTVALRHSEAARLAGPRRRGAGGVLAALPTWGGVLVTVLLLARGKLALGAIAFVATVVHAGIVRAREAHARRP